ncbi:RNA recognition motif domain [Cinara cedri]|uniref:RNA recognition motif domain n=1 Tax=Cinara cedri TaxID=506608 RepID=A0A5E4MAP9_9HEMI|nr:RNA recognition motif domain [Cinara cedri]
MAKSLFIGNLSNTVTLSDLRALFGPIGEISSIRLSKDVRTGRSLGYGYVTFETSTDASRAIETINCSQLNGKPIEIAWSWHDPAVQKCQNANLYISGLKPEIDAKCLYDTFIAFGELISCQVAYDKLGVSKGYGYIHFWKEKDAEECVNKLNGICIHGQAIYISKSNSKEDRQNNITDQGKFTNVHISNLSEEFNGTDLYDMFEVYGEITSVKVVRKENGDSKRFGFVNFQKPDDAKKAVEELNGKPSPSGENYYVSCAHQKYGSKDTPLKTFENTERVEPSNKVNLYIRNLDGTVTDERLKHEFSAFGVVTRAIVMKENGRSKGVGFVHFETAEQASNAMAQKNRSVINNNIIYVSLAQRKADRLTKNSNNKSLVNAETAEPEGNQNVESPNRLTEVRKSGITTDRNNTLYRDSANNTSPYRATEMQHPRITPGNNMYYDSANNTSPYRATEMQHPRITSGNNMYYGSAHISSPYGETEIQHPVIIPWKNVFNCGNIYDFL